MVEIVHEEKDGIYLIKVSGEIDASSSIFLDDELDNAVKHYPKIIVDLTGLEYISSAGLGVFMSYIQELESQNAQMILVGLKEKVFQVFQILGLDQLLTIEKDTASAKLKLQ